MPNAQLIPDDRLRTRNLGLWEGWNTEQIICDGGAWFSPFAAGRPPGGESIEEVSARVWNFLHDLLADSARTHVVVTHGAVIGMILGELGSCPVIIPACTSVVISYSELTWSITKRPVGSVPPV